MNEKVKLEHGTLFCYKCGEIMEEDKARLMVQCQTHQLRNEQITPVIKFASEQDREHVRGMLRYFWGKTELSCFGTKFRALDQINIIAEVAGKPVGLISLAIRKKEGIIPALAVYPAFQGYGLGKKLFEKGMDYFKSKGIKIVKVSTTNDNLPAMYFYQKIGFALDKVIPGRVKQIHKGKEIPGFGGIPIRDEVNLKLVLS